MTSLAHIKRILLVGCLIALLVWCAIILRCTKRMQFQAKLVMSSQLATSQQQRAWPLPNVTVRGGVRCSALFAGDTHEVAKAYRLMRRPPDVAGITDDEFAQLHCAQFLRDRRYVLRTLSQEELDFPVAFSIVMHKDVAQFERLLRAVYRPHNAYCVHVDAKASPLVQRAVARLVSCFPAANVILAPTPVDVRWGWYSVLEADLVCFRALLQRFAHWKYIINLTGQEFPLRTHRELVRILSILNGANSIEGTVRRRNEGRVPKTKLPFPVTWLKGSVHVAASRAFVTFLFNNRKAQRIHQVLKRAYVPDEQLFATLNHNPQLGAPGAYLGAPETDQRTYHFIARLKNWGDPPFNYPCRSGHWVRQICIWGVHDLPFIAQRYELFVNKFYWQREALALDCMEQRFWERSVRDYRLGQTAAKPPLDLDEGFYKRLAIVRLHQ